MTKTELIEKIAGKTGLSRLAVASVINAYSETVTEALKAGDKVSVAGFGTFEARERAERQGINPKTMEKIVVPSCKAACWKAAKALKDVLNDK